MKLWPSILPRLHTTTTTSTNRRTLFTLVTASTVFLLSTQPPSTLASTPSFAGAHQRTFRLGRPAAGLNTDAPRFFSSMPVNLPSQNEAFDGFAQLPLEQPSESTAQLIRDAMDLFGAKPTAELFRRSWMPNAVFADPICHAEGSRQYLAQWYGMPAAFAKSETLEWKLVKQHDSEVQYVQKQRYTVKGLGTTKDMVVSITHQPFYLTLPRSLLREREERHRGREVKRKRKRWY